MTEGGSGNVSRRRVLQGTAWSVPAVLIATAAPAAAVSYPVAGAIALAELSASMVEATFRVRCRVAYVDNDDAITDLPVDQIRVSVLLPTSRVSAGHEFTVLSPQWSLASPPTTEDDLTVYTFQWNIDGELTQADDLTPVLEVQIAKSNTSLDPVDVTYRAVGRSGGGAVPPVSATIPVVVGANLVLNSSSPIRYQYDSERARPLYAFDGTTRWAGPYYPVGAVATPPVVTFRIPQEKTTGELVPQYVGPDWSLTSGPTLNQATGEWEVVYSYGKNLTPEFQNTSTLQVAMMAAGTAATDIAALRTAALAAGNIASAVHVGPDQLTYVDWSNVPRYTVGGEIHVPHGN